MANGQSQISQEIKHFDWLHAEKWMDVEQQNNIWIVFDGLYTASEHLKLRAFHVNLNHLDRGCFPFLKKGIQCARRDFQRALAPLGLTAQ